MNDMLKELWYGKLRPQEEILRQNPVYQKLVKQNADDWALFGQSLTEQQQNALQTLLADTDDLRMLYAYLSFRFGVQMAQSMSAGQQNGFLGSGREQLCL